MMDARNLISYKEGEPFSNCTSDRANFNHAIVVVGRTEEGNWIVRNSWGKGWG